MRNLCDNALAQAALGILIDVVLLAFASYSQSAQFALGMLAFGCFLALAWLLVPGRHSVGGRKMLGAVFLFVIYMVWLTRVCSNCGE